MISGLLLSRFFPGKNRILVFSAVQRPHLLDSGEYDLALAMIFQTMECVLFEGGPNEGGETSRMHIGWQFEVGIVLSKP